MLTISNRNMLFVIDVKTYLFINYLLVLIPYLNIFIAVNMTVSLIFRFINSCKPGLS